MLIMNLSVISIINGTCKDPSIMNLVRSLYFYSAIYNIEYRAFRISSEDNILADAISRHSWNKLFMQAPYLDRETMCIPLLTLDFFCRPRCNCRQFETYSSVQILYIHFCQYYNLEILSATEQLLLRYIAYLLSKNLLGSSMKVHLSAIHSLHVILGVQVPPIYTPSVKLALKSVLETNRPTSKRDPATHDMLDQMLLLLQRQSGSFSLECSFLSSIFWCPKGGGICSTIHFWYGLDCPAISSRYLWFFHCEGVHAMEVNIKRSKTNMYGKKVKIGCTNKHAFAPCTMWLYLQYRGSLLPASPLLTFKSGTVLNKELLNKKIQALVSLLGLPPDKYSSHSFRSGAATSAALNGLKDWEVKELGGWASSAYQDYIHSDLMHQVRLASRLT